jgi:NitT/TauT family transport system permease protein
MSLNADQSAASPVRRAARPWKMWAVRLVLVALFCACWKGVTLFGMVNPVFIGTPEGTLREFIAQFSDPTIVAYDLRFTVIETAIGFAIASVSGTAVAVLLYWAPTARKAVMPLVVAANSLPRVALAPLFVLWFGLGIPGKVALVVSLVFFVMLSTTLAGLTQPNRDFEYLSRSIGCSRSQHVMYFVFPAAVPTILAGMELSITYSFLGAVAGEIVGGSYGVGVRLTAFANSFEINKFMALLVLLVIVSTASVQLMRRLTSRFTRWHAIEGTGEA